jgi:hypothetical protein
LQTKIKEKKSMGRTLAPFRPALEMELETWKEFRRGLRPEDQLIFDLLANDARRHADAGSLAARPLLSEVLFFSFAIEQQKQIHALETKIELLSAQLKRVQQPNESEAMSLKPIITTEMPKTTTKSITSGDGPK